MCNKKKDCLDNKKEKMRGNLKATWDFVHVQFRRYLKQAATGDQNFKRI